jgi:hypothetical protein
VRSGIADAADLVRKSNLPRARILVIVVLYKMPLTESHTIQGLLQAFASYPELHEVAICFIQASTICGV